MSGVSPLEGLIVLPTRHTPADILARTVAIARSRGITVFAQIDFSGDAARSNLTLKPTCLVILGNPVAGTPVMAATPTVAIDLPLKILGAKQHSTSTHLQRSHTGPEYHLARLLRGQIHRRKLRADVLHEVTDQRQHAVAGGAGVAVQGYVDHDPGLQRPGLRRRGPQ
jgi:hypothetical protein